MTRNVPGWQPSPGYSSTPQGEYGQPSRYGESQYGDGPAEENNHGYSQTQAIPYTGGSAGQAQSYYAPNDQPYQQYSENNSWNRSPAPYSQGQYNQQQNPALQEYGQQPYGQAPHPQQNYSAPQYPHEQTQYSPPPQPHYAEGYNAEGQQYGQRPSTEVDDFKSHFDRPSVPAAEYSNAPPVGSEDERGVMGALAGGAAGAYGGHKMGHHGFLGGIGGAVAGSMLEDAYKKHHKKEEAERHRLQNQPPAVPPHPSNMGGNFHASSKDVRLEDRCTLVAECLDMGGRHRLSRIDLNDCLTNTNGQIFWAQGGNFAASARQIRLTDNGNALEAELGDGQGGWRHNKIWLNERITNDDGRLSFLHT